MKKYTSEKENEKPHPENAGAQDLPAGLYLVATPIGNLRDISLRALDVLKAVDGLLCEDTRVTRKLLGAYGVDGKKLVSYNDHSDEAARDRVLERLAKGERLALVSDAGMPLVSDPGYKLVRACVAQGIYVTSVPGASAPLMALQLSGFPSDKFCFLGFLPPKSAARRKVLEGWRHVQGSLIAFETAPRLLDALADIAAVYGGRQVAVARELTKFFEEVRRGDALALVRYYQDKGLPKGEIVLVIAPDEGGGMPSDEEIAERLRAAMGTMSVKEAAAFVAAETGAARKKIYEMALDLKKGK
ncbi:MAG: 16S rRNA (cytidine(1402)-2'-O)-methyltransferase [Alphaproteobacteria bacterium]|nr:16S rRNA (cytidine(1402)-2'-O)-methyltransferase [Alphaproteobacteria bacterium]